MERPTTSSKNECLDADLDADLGAESPSKPPAETTEAAVREDEKGTTRRRALRAFGKLGLGAAFGGAAALSSPLTAYAQDGPTLDGPAGILNFALALEYLEATYYRMGLDSGVIEGDDADAVYSLITEHEQEHVAVLQAAIEDAGATPIPDDAVNFDFTGRQGDDSADPMFQPFQNYGTFLLLSQAFEDTGVRAYKGQAPNIPADLNLANLNVLTAALQIHALEGRHAAEVRRLRAMYLNSEGQMAADGDLEPWVDEDDDTDGSPVAPVYDGEGNVTQPASGDLATDLSSALSGDYTDEQIAESFDEPLAMGDVLAIANLFVEEDLEAFFGTDDGNGGG